MDNVIKVDYNSQRIQKMLKSSYQVRKRQAWEHFSRMIRLEGVLDLMSELGRDEPVIVNGLPAARCCTCPKIDAYKGEGGEGMEAGHFITRNKILTFMDKRNVHPQCNACNNFRKGEQSKHGDYIIKRYGQSVYDDLKRLEMMSKRGAKGSKLDFIETEEVSKRRVKEIKQQLGLK